MSSFYDETGRIIAWAARTQLPPADLAEILTRRLAQAEAHWAWCAKRSAKARKLREDLQTNGTDQMRLLRDFLLAIGVLALDGPTEFFAVAGIAYREFGRYEPGDAGVVYASRWEDLLDEPFQVLHTAGHDLARLNLGFSDNPYPGSRRSIPNSNTWLKEKYAGEFGRLPWDAPP